MSVTAEGMAEGASESVTGDGHPHSHAPQGSLAKLMLGATGVVFGDIGTSPIYAFRETFAGHHTLEPDRLHIYGVLSLIFWSMMIIVTLKYVTILLRADNKGEGGSLALLALINRSTSDTRRWTAGIVMLGVFATALFYGDSMITPAISVLSAVEGLTTVNAGFEPYVLPICIGILVGLFMIQSRGTARVGNLFGPVMIFYFSTLAVLGLWHIGGYPSLLLQMLNPGNALAFYIAEPLPAFIALGSVVLAVTGAEALYADMGHFGRRPIRFAWAFVMAALLLNYLGQGAMLLQQSPETARELVKNPFFFLAPEALRLPLVLLATCATIIASQAVITGAFSVTQQAIQLGFIPRLRILQTSESAKGQIYIPVINWALMAAVILLVVSFGSSSNLAAAYGIAVFSCTWPGIPLIYNGQELPNHKRLQFFEKDVIEWGEEYGLNKFYKKLFALKKLSALASDATLNIISADSNLELLVFTRSVANASVKVALNFSAHERMMGGSGDMVPYFSDDQTVVGEQTVLVPYGFAIWVSHP